MALRECALCSVWLTKTAVYYAVSCWNDSLWVNESLLVFSSAVRFLYDHQGQNRRDNVGRGCGLWGMCRQACNVHHYVTVLCGLQVKQSTRLTTPKYDVRGHYTPLLTSLTDSCSPCCSHYVLGWRMLRRNLAAEGRICPPPLFQLILNC